MITVQNTISTSTFQFWIDRTNEMANYFSTCAVTTDANSSTAAATGNAAITGKFTAALGVVAGNATVNVVANSTTLTFANSTVTYSVAAPNTVQVGNSYVLSSNSGWVANPVLVSNVALTGNNVKTIDSYPMSLYNGAEYLVTVVDTQPSANARYVSKLLTTHDTVNALVTEYASFTTNGALGTFSVSSNTTHVQLLYTSLSANATITYNVRFVRTII